MQRRQAGGAIAGMVMALLGMAACGSSGGKGAAGSGAAGAGTGTLSIAVIPKGSTHEHWARVRRGADKAAAEAAKPRPRTIKKSRSTGRGFILS